MSNFDSSTRLLHYSCALNSPVPDRINDSISKRLELPLLLERLMFLVPRNQALPTM
ncbi:hypothetical protein K443DRAFT_676866 [Laccaria amethystina LaAM-08-1]|uniref:Uncharacterized protein n=1 Tax=Laccaria amethystina LaAM-08-1 TaxID=1095629 RepID=A0A0C9Y079_9AGAR|nr:hypothetical protein K443DRAFT_676866 [Laccaria amethystina LaAM-08-1]